MPCRSCRSSLAADQRYCLECGTRNGPARLDWRALTVPPAATPPDAGPGLPSPRLAAALVTGALAFGVVLGHAVGPGAGAADAGGRPNVTILQPGQAPPVLATAPLGAPPAAEPAPDIPAGSADTPATAPAADVRAPADSGAPAADPPSTPAPADAPAATTPADTPATAPPRTPPVKHVWVVALTGHSYDETFGPASPAPYLSGELRAKGTLLSWYHAVGHDPSAGAVALLGGQKDATGPFGASVPTLAGELTDAGRSWKAYVEGARDGLEPGANPCARPPEQQPRNPFLRFASITGASECGSSLAGLDRLAPDIADPEQAPAFSYILPGPAHDGSSSLPDADTWLHDTVEPILASKAYADGGLIVVTFDAGAPDDPVGGGGRTGALLLSPFVTPGATIGAPYDAFALLRSIEDLFGLDPLGYAKDTRLKSFGPKVYAAWTPPAS
jgi:hypothetical protein